MEQVFHKLIQKQLKSKKNLLDISSKKASTEEETNNLSADFNKITA